jgi:hypothetical protein
MDAYGLAGSSVVVIDAVVVVAAAVVVVVAALVVLVGAGVVVVPAVDEVEVLTTHSSAGTHSALSFQKYPLAQVQVATQSSLSQMGNMSSQVG